MADEKAWQGAEVLSHVAELALMEKEPDPAKRFAAVVVLLYRLIGESQGAEPAAEFMREINRISAKTMAQFTTAGTA